jgi:stress-induced morphogen
MSIYIPRGNSDPVIDQIIERLKVYESDHPGAQIDLYRQNPASVRVRIIDTDFGGLNRIERHKLVWNYLNNLSEETQSDISTLILLAPDESERSFASFEFNDPVPSLL